MSAESPQYPESREGQQGVDRVRLQVDEWLEGIAATKEGILKEYFIVGRDDRLITVTPYNADEIELDIRVNYAERYPDLAIQGTSLPELH